MEHSHHLNKVHVLALATLAILFLSPIINADVGIGAIVIDSQIEGKGDLKTNGGINVGDTITTGPKGNVTILFDDESMLTLGANAKAKIVKYSETPAPGVSEINIISGGFRYFPGIILEKGGVQVLNNIGGTSTSEANPASASNLALSPGNQTINDENLDNLNEQLTDVSALLNDVTTNDVATNIITPVSGASGGLGGGITSGSGGE